MKKTLTKTSVMLALMLILAFGGNSVISALQTGVIEGENEVNNLPISVIVPTNLNFTLDPFELNTVGGNQIVDTNYFFINKTGAPVKVSFEITAKLKEGVSLVDTPSDLEKDLNSSPSKDIYFAILGARDLLTEDLAFENVEEHSARGVYDSYSDTIIPFDPETKNALIEFVLASATESIPGESGIDTLAYDNKGVGAFQFYGELNAYASWAASDITVAGAYTIAPLRSTAYENYLDGDEFTTNGWGTQLRQSYTVDTDLLYIEETEE